MWCDVIHHMQYRTAAAGAQRPTTCSVTEGRYGKAVLAIMHIDHVITNSHSRHGIMPDMAHVMCDKSM